MSYAYIRASTDRQTAENQRFEILKKTAADRVLGLLLASMKPKDVL